MKFHNHTSKAYAHFDLYRSSVFTAARTVLSPSVPEPINALVFPRQLHNFPSLFCLSRKPHPSTTLHARHKNDCRYFYTSSRHVFKSRAVPLNTFRASSRPRPELLPPMTNRTTSNGSHERIFWCAPFLPGSTIYSE